MVALVVLAVASAGLVGATQAHIDTIRGLETRATAQWVAENRLVELGRQGAVPSAEQAVEMMGRSWRVAVSGKPTEDPDIVAVEVAVREADATSAAVVLGGFIDTGRARP